VACPLPTSRQASKQKYEPARLRDAQGYSQEARLNRAYMGGVERGRRNVGVVNLYRIARALDLSLSELLAEVARKEGRGGG
jgi:transcriptional regulator with XRE-family HTH domain